MWVLEVGEHYEGGTVIGVSETEAGIKAMAWEYFNRAWKEENERSRGEIILFPLRFRPPANDQWYEDYNGTTPTDGGGREQYMPLTLTKWRNDPEEDWSWSRYFSIHQLDLDTLKPDLYYRILG